MPSTAATQSYMGQLHRRIREARAHSDQLFEIVRPEALYDRPIPERHRIIFYMGHLEAFDWNLFLKPLGLASFDPVFDKLFAFGIDPVEGGLPNDQPRDWPPIEIVQRYAGRLRETLDDALRTTGSKGPGLALLENAHLLDIAIEHRLMHAETLCYMLHQLPTERKFASRDLAAPAVTAHTPRKVEIPSGAATLGMRRVSHPSWSPLQEQNGSFGWDNEFDEHRVEVPAFAIDAYPVTNQDYLRFVREGGYRNRSLWNDAGWEYISSQGREHPVFWLRQGDSWAYRAMFDKIPLPLDCPVYVSHDEASAYALWSKQELPSEAEWHRAAYATRDGSERTFPWGAEPPSPRHGNFDLQRWDPTPVGSFPEGSSDFGVADLIGNGWEWTRTPFAPFPGFEPFPSYPGYSANFFDGKHFVMKGGSPRTAACMLRRSFRNWFQPHYPYVYATFRCVRR